MFMNPEALESMFRENGSYDEMNGAGRRDMRINFSKHPLFKSEELAVIMNNESD